MVILKYRLNGNDEIIRDIENMSLKKLISKLYGVDEKHIHFSELFKNRIDIRFSKTYDISLNMNNFSSVKREYNDSLGHTRLEDLRINTANLRELRYELKSIFRKVETISYEQITNVRIIDEQVN